MTKSTPRSTQHASRSKASLSKASVKAALAKTSSKRTAVLADDPMVLFVLGFDEQQKPCGARFIDGSPDVVAKAAKLMGFKAYRTASPEVVEAAKRLPIGKLYASGRGFVPNIRPEVYSDLVVELGGDRPSSMPGVAEDSLPAARGLPRCWDEIGPGHLVIAQESQTYGWWEAIVLDRKDEMFTLQYRDYPHLPRFVRHRSAVALMYAPDEDTAAEAPVKAS